MPGSIMISDGPYGYERTDDLQERFVAAAEALRVADGWADPARGGERRLRCDLVLEGCGVKGVGLVAAALVLDEAGYEFRRVAGTSAGAIAASVIAATAQAGRSLTEALARFRTLDFAKFAPDGRVHALIDKMAGRVGRIALDAAILSERPGVYSGDYLAEWLEPVLSDLGVRTFADLALPEGFDDEVVLPATERYRLVVFASDLTRGRLARLPWDYPLYGHDPGEIAVVDAVRASMSIPLVFEPVRFAAREAVVERPHRGGGTVATSYPAGPVTWVDGALLAKYPVHTFDRLDGSAARWPTIGIKLDQPSNSAPPAADRESALDIVVQCVRTMVNELEFSDAHELAAARTIFVDNAGLSATDFSFSDDERSRLFLNGVAAATDFVIAAAEAGGVRRR